MKSTNQKKPMITTIKQPTTSEDKEADHDSTLVFLVMLAALVLALCSGGCASTNITELTKALANDPAIVVVKVGTVYGTVNFTRVGATTNGMTISPDGTVAIKQP